MEIFHIDQRPVKHAAGSSTWQEPDLLTTAPVRGQPPLAGHAGTRRWNVLPRILTQVVIAVALLFPFAARSDASVYTGCRWQHSPVNVYIPGAHKFWGSARAMQVWDNVRRGQPQLRRVYTRANANVRIHHYRAGGETNAYTTYSCHPGFMTADVYLNDARGLGIAAREKSMVHEFGHVLGLGHRSLPGRTVMHPRLSGESSHPTRLDRRALGRLY